MKTEEDGGGQLSEIHEIEVELQPFQNHEIEEVEEEEIHEIEVELQPFQNHEIEEVEEEEKDQVPASQVAIDAVWLSSVEEKSKRLPKWLNSSAASTSCSIFRVPKSIMKLHSKSFRPSLVSIGPYYHGDEEVRIIEEHKWRILRGNLDRLQNCKVTLHDLFQTIAIREKEIRECYSENIDRYNRHNLIEMMILDGGFIIELLCVVKGVIIPERTDPIFGFPWMLSSLTRDLLMLENQIPFFVLHILYAKSISDHCEVPPLQELVLELFDHSVPRYSDVSILRQKYKNYDGKHILDFYRSTFLPLSEKMEKEKAIDRCSSCLPGRPSSHKEKTIDRGDSPQPASKEDTVEGSSSPTEKTIVGRDSTRSGSAEVTIEAAGLSSFRSEKTMDDRDSAQLLAKKDTIEAKKNDKNENGDWWCNCLPVKLSSHKEKRTNERDLMQPLSEKDNGGEPSSRSEKTTDMRYSTQSSSKEDNVQGRLILHVVQPVEKLREAGIKFKKREEEGLDSFLEIKFENGILEIPCVTTSEIMIPLILNFIAFEQCYTYSTKHFTSYFNFMGYLINSTVDAQHLRKKNIIENFFGTDQELVSFFNEVGKNIPYYYEEDYLTEICEKIKIYYQNVWHVRRAEFLNKYCGSPWIIMSACAAVFVILLSVIQGFLALHKFIKKY
ncbi:hypothetical protein M5689_020987 [Euphorbia peplus]|nr:hypothetical protein M5689_020987 [Euphorbia peplus]